MSQLVSILIPAYNAERWLAETIRSAQAQTWPDWEVIAVDDGSSDRTWEVLQSFQSGRVKVVRQPNGGASAARNKALSLAQGNYIQWLDADDLLAPDKIARQLARGYPPDSSEILSCAFGEFFCRPERARFVRSSLWQDLSPVDWLCIKFVETVWMNPAAWLLSRRVAELAGPWDERLSLNDDGEYFSRAVALSGGVRFVDDARSYYRIGNLTSLSNRLSERACQSLFLSLELCIRHLLELEDSDRSREASVKLLQSQMIRFFPKEAEIVSRMSALARQLGGTLSPPLLKPKYRLVQRMLGWEAAIALAFGAGRIKTQLRQRYESLLARIQPQR